MHICGGVSTLYWDFYPGSGHAGCCHLAPNRHTACTMLPDVSPPPAAFSVPLLILVISCAAHRTTRQPAVLSTWARTLPPGVELWLVEGGLPAGSTPVLTPIPEVAYVSRCCLAVADSYDDLAEKTYAAVAAAIALRPTAGLLKCDDDTWLHVPRLCSAVDWFAPYQGAPASDQPQFAPYARGGAYWLGPRAARALVAHPFTQWADRPWFKGNSRMRKRGESAYRENVSIEDVMTGDILAQNGIPLTADERFSDAPAPSVYEDPTLLSNHYVTPARMQQLERQRRRAGNPLWQALYSLQRWWPRHRKPR
jgi:hypothetical protein